MDSDTARQVLQRRGPGGLKHVDIRCLATKQWIREGRLSGGRVDTKSNTADLVTFFCRGTTKHSRCPKNMDCILVETRTDSLTTALPVEQGCK